MLYLTLGILYFESTRVGSVTSKIHDFSEGLEGDGMLNSHIWNGP